MKNKTVKIIGAGNVALQHARELFFLNARLIFDDIDLSKVNFLKNIFSTSLAKKNSKIDYLFDCRPARFRTSDIKKNLKYLPKTILIEKPAFFSEKLMNEYFKAFKHSKIIQNSFRTKHENFRKLKKIILNNKQNVTDIKVYESFPEQKTNKAWMSTKLDVQIDYLPHSLSLIFNLLDLYDVNNIKINEDLLTFSINDIKCTVEFIAANKNCSELVIRTDTCIYNYNYPMNCYQKTSLSGNGIVDSGKQCLFNISNFINTSKSFFSKIRTGELSNYRNFKKTYNLIDSDSCDRNLIRASTKILSLYNNINLIKNNSIHTVYKKKYENIIIGGGRLCNSILKSKLAQGNKNLVISRTKIKKNSTQNVTIQNYSQINKIIKHTKGRRLVIVGHPMGGSFSDNISFLTDVIKPITLYKINFDEIIYISSIAAKSVDGNDADKNKNINFQRSAYAFGKRECENFLANKVEKNKLRILRFPLISYNNENIQYFFTIKFFKFRFVFASADKEYPVLSSNNVIKIIFNKKINHKSLTQYEHLKTCEKEKLIFINKYITFIICKIFSKLFSRNKFPESLWLKFKIFY